MRGVLAREMTIEYCMTVVLLKVGAQSCMIVLLLYTKGINGSC